jgi:tight adherence protein C
MTPTDFLPAGLTTEDAIVAMAGLAALFTVLAVWHGLLVRDPLRARIKELAQRREALMSDIKSPRQHGQRLRSIGLMHQVVKRLKLLRSAKTGKIADRLAQAGWRSKDAVVVYLFVRVCLPIVLAAVAVFSVYVLEAYNLPPMGRLGAVLASIVVGFYVSAIVVKNAVDKRRDKLRKGLPDALDLLVICAEAGLSLDSGLRRVAKEMTRAHPEIADELGLTAVELGFVPDRRQALKNLTKRTDLASIRGVVNTLSQSERYGTPLAQSLRVLAAEFRNERMMRAEEKAARLPAILTVPMILFVLPPLFVVLLGPGILRFVDTLSAAPI